MENLEQFRAETREWLEANCPEDMRQPMRSDEDQCWGGRNWVFKSEGQKLWLERMAAKAGQHHAGQLNTAAVVSLAPKLRSWARRWRASALGVR